MRLRAAGSDDSRANIIERVPDGPGHAGSRIPGSSWRAATPSPQKRPPGVGSREALATLLGFDEGFQVEGAGVGGRLDRSILVVYSGGVLGGILGEVMGGLTSSGRVGCGCSLLIYPVISCVLPSSTTTCGSAKEGSTRDVESPAGLYWSGSQ